MSKFCELAGKVTNCTDDCRKCLEEEFEDNDIEIGDKVRYITEDPEEVKESGYFPPKGTVGVVIGIEHDVAPYHIKWPERTTSGDGCWYVSRKNIEKV